MTKPSNKSTSQPIKNNRPLLLMRDTSISFPELWLSVYLTGPEHDRAGFPEMFARGRCRLSETIEDADLVVFTGGPDVDPQFYGAKKHLSTHINAERDQEDLETYAQCYDQGIPMFGVCRGAQFGHVMNGGILIQDLNNHHGDHYMYTDNNNESMNVSSVHHQACYEQEGMDIIGWAMKSTRRSLDNTVVETGVKADVEAFFYRDTCFFGVQGHPEYKGYLSFTHWCLSQIESLIVHNPDVRPKGKTYRLSDEFLEQRARELVNTYEVKENLN